MERYANSRMQLGFTFPHKFTRSAGRSISSIEDSQFHASMLYGALEQRLFSSTQVSATNNDRGRDVCKI